ncbi:EAL domain-containing protein [Methylovorus sp. MP688]|jgi:diguanylate cyclase (GGDEF)-like protein/PAS domain S-box-containing protein|uniref:EAL domain-containing protein n=1 Tax=Methylovorus sp. (strain MP688) TaxID=887061 RepID=UPI0001EC44BF|nr:EAL domain-containing protein [Methylovorus sp. MP688]ADQ83748.1 diguanylate cyclase/phosphodiesterase with PAS/PAC and GAF sensor(s) [Methylovorus sp. MP688]
MALTAQTESDLIHQLLHAMDGVAVIAFDAKLHIRYASPYALQILSLKSPSRAKLPASIGQRVLAELQKNNLKFTLQHAVGNALKSFCVQIATLEPATAGADYVLYMQDVTERFASEYELRSMLNLLRKLIDASPDYICLKDGAGRWLHANTSGLSLLHLNGVNTQGKTDRELADLTHPNLRDFMQHWQAADEYVWETGQLLREEETVPLPGGDRVLDVIKVPLFHDDGSRHGIVTLGRDITDRKQVESQLRQRSAILDALISCDWLLHSSESWQKVAVGVLELLGLASHASRAALLKNSSDIEAEAPISELLHHWNAPGFKPLSDGYHCIDYLRDGCSRWLNILQQGSPIFGNADDFPPDERRFLLNHDSQSFVIIPIFVHAHWWGVIMIERDHAASTVTSQELGALMSIGRSFGVAIQRESSDHRLHQAKIAFESTAEGIFITDDELRTIAINQGFTDITGYTEDDVLGNIPNVLEADLKKPEPHREIWKALTREGRWRGEFWNQRKNNEQYAEWVTLTAVNNEEGKVINYVGVFADISEIKHSQSRLNELVNRDPLTGLPNRRLMHELLDHAIKYAEREQNEIALLFVDLDRFKAINDTLGHQMGDKLLFEVSQRIRAAVRDSDAVARLGGDEFIVMMDVLREREDAAKVAKKIISSLQNEFLIDGRELFISASVGISVYPDDSLDVDGLIKAADIAMYQVKNKGKNNHCFYSADLSQNAVERFTLENQLRRALARDQFEVYYQAQVSLETGRIIGAESLIRWIHPELGVVSPAKFIPLAEETGLIIPIGEWVLRQSAMQVKEWHDQGFDIDWVSVNVSGVQIQRSNFADTVYGILVETDCESHLLELEITESTVMHNTEYVIDVFDRIKHLGVRLAIDDFGTGYSSLSHLKRLPLDKIKIDQSFVRDLPNNSDDAAIATAINAMAQSLGFTVIAEGVETRQQASFLKKIGCQQGQGYLYSRPVTASEFTALLRAEQLNNKK